MSDETESSERTVRRGNFEGSITQERGKFRVRITPPDKGKRRSLGIYPTEDEAERVLNAALADIDAGLVAAQDGKTLRSFAPTAFDVMEKRGMKTVDDDRYRFDKHLVKAKFIDWPLPKIQVEDVEDFLVQLEEVEIERRDGSRGPLSHQTKKHILGVLRRILKRAKKPPYRYVAKNVAEFVEVEEEGTKAPRDKANYLALAEIEALRDANIDDPEVWIILFAIGTAIRVGEQWNLPLSHLVVDGDDPHVLVEYGDSGTVDDRTKSGNIVKVPLFGLGLEAAQRWLELLPAYCKKNEHRLAFPGRHGGRRTKAPNLWYLDNIKWHRAKDPNVRAKRALARAGITRNIRWHDLRHTAASGWLSGYWGRRFTLQEVSKLLNHTDIKVTQRYAKFAESAVREAAREAEEAYRRLREGK
jgi:integrase